LGEPYMKKIQSFIPAMLTLILIVIAFTTPWLIVQHIGKGEIHDVASEKATIASDQRALVDEIVGWQENNLEDLWDQKHRYPYIEISDVKYYRVSEYPHIYMRRHDSWWVMFFRYGKCEEYAILFAELVNTAGFGGMRARVVYNFGIDHVWNDVWVDEGWMHVDSIKNHPVTKKQGIIDDPDYYERSENGMGENLFFVYAVDEEGNPHDVTENYVETSKLSELTVRVVREDKPVSEAKVTVKSLRTGKSTKAPFRTDENGTCTFNLTENENYKIAAESGWIGNYRRAEAIVHIDKDNEIHLHLSSSSFFPPEVAVLLIKIIIILCFFLLIWKFSPAGIAIGGPAFVFYGLNGWELLPIIIGSTVFGFGLRGFINHMNPIPKNHYLLVAGILMTIAALVCSYAGLISCPANLLWIMAALAGFVSAYATLWKRQFQKAFVGALITITISFALLLPLCGFGFMPALSVIILSLSSAILMVASRKLKSNIRI
jgi:hypothetical protein